jgi:uncharacterized protein (TIGR00369 family)
MASPVKTLPAAIRRLTPARQGDKRAHERQSRPPMTDPTTPSPSPEDVQARIRANAPALFTIVPFARALGMELVEVRGNEAIAKIAWREDLVGDPETGVIHGGVITALMDNLCGFAVMLALREFRSTATLDLRIDYMRAATPGRDVLARAECYRVTRHIAFVRATAFHAHEEPDIAAAAGAFVLNDPQRWGSGVRNRAASSAGDAKP